MDSIRPTDIAVVGMACRFPGADDHAEFYANLRKGVDSIQEIPPERWDLDRFYSPDFDAPNRSNSRWLGALDDVDRFDNTFFQISPREARIMDPQQRLTLEEAWHCIEDSGVPLDELQSRRTAVHVGMMSLDYQRRAMGDASNIDSYASTGNCASVTANRLSYVFGLRGPSYATEAACASSLVAIHQARETLVDGRSDFALAAGVCLFLEPFKFISLAKSRFYSPDGRCRAFDHRANGMVNAEGVGVLLLQPLEDALADGNHVYGVLRGSAVNHCGQSKSLTAPRVRTQRDLVLEAYDEAPFGPDSVSYVEAHGTGTALGDPIEVEALTQAFRRYTDARQYCAIGSVKSNIGHLDAAAGVAGLMKVLTMLQHREIPASLHVEATNPLIPFEETPFVVATDRQPWTPVDDDLPLRASVSSFGFGGASSHVVVEEAPASPTGTALSLMTEAFVEGGPEAVRALEPGESASTTPSDVVDGADEAGHPFVLSARSEEALVNTWARWRAFAENDAFDASSLRDLCATTAAGRQSFDVRHGGWVRSHDELRDLLAETPATAFQTAPTWTLTIGALSIDGGAAFDALRRHDPPVEAHWTRIVESLPSDARDRVDAFDDATWDEADRELFRFIAAQAYVDRLLDVGLEPESVVGVGHGVWNALVTAGAVSLDDALAVLSGTRDLDAVDVTRPEIPLWDPVRAERLPPVVLDAAYLHALVDDLGVTDAALRRTLHDGRTISHFAFRRYMQEWDQALTDAGCRDTGAMLDDDALARSDADARERLLAMLAVHSSLYRVRKKWGIAGPSLDVDPRIHELVRLVADGVLSVDTVITLLDPATDPATLVDAFRPDALDVDTDDETESARTLADAYPLLASRSQRLHELDDFARWIDRAAAPDAARPSGVEASLHVGTSSSEASPDAEGIDGTDDIDDIDTQVDVPSDLAVGTRRTALRLWRRGTDVDWTSVYPRGTYRRLALPTYAFDRRSFWLWSGREGDGAVVNGERPPTRDSDPVSESTDALAPMTTDKTSNDSADDAASADGEDADTDGGDRLFYRPSWTATPLPASDASTNDVETVLVVGDADAVVRTARTAPAFRDKTVVTVAPSEAFRRVDETTFEVDVRRREDVARVLDRLDDAGRRPDAVLVCSVDRSTPSDADAVQRRIDRSLQAATHLSRALLDRPGNGPAHLWYAYAGAPGASSPYHAAMTAFARSARAEDETLSWRTLEVRVDDDLGDVRAVDLLVDRAADELRAPGDALAVRYVDGERSTWTLAPAEIESPADANAEIPIRPDGVYVITGGAGRLGQTFARHLAACGPVTLVLTGRSELSPERARRIEALEDTGATVAYVQNDVSDRDDAHRLIEHVRDRFGAVHGVLHAAGVVEPRYLIQKTPDELDRVVAPKVHGTTWLAEAIDAAAVDVDVLALFSSISSVMGFDGLVDYAYGNGFLDHVAAEREARRARGEDVTRTLSINWPMWADGGMQFSEADEKRFSERSGVALLSTRQGLDLWDALLERCDHPQCFAAVGDREAFEVAIRDEATVDAPTVPESAATESRDDQTRGADSGDADSGDADPDGVDEATLRARTETFLRGILADETEMPPETIQLDRHFEAYGIDSVMVHHFNNRISKTLGSASKTLLFETRTLRELVDYFVANRKDALEAFFGDDLHAAPTSDTHAGEAGEGEAALAEPASDKVAATVPLTASTGAASTPSEPTAQAGVEPIAIVGASGRFPGAPTLDAFWDNLKSGRDSVTEVPSTRWDADAYFDADPERADDGKHYAKWGAFVDDVDMFDPLFFNISHREAESLDPQERLFLETAWSAFEDAGYSRPRLDDWRTQHDTDVGVFVGATTNTYLLNGPGEWSRGNYAVPQSLPWSIANRISYVFDFHGPSMPVDTACASSLTAIHLACQSLREEDNCGMAVVGGVNLLLHPGKYLYLCQKRMLSPRGRCHAFGAKADGFVPGEGVAAVLLKPLAQAEADGDRIHGVIRGTARNHGGHTHGYTVPNPNAQSQLIQNALRQARVRPETISYVEAHGTGTALGDPIEVTGLTHAFREAVQNDAPDAPSFERTQPCALGSVKSNIGHLESAAGLAGVLKVLLQMKHGTLAPSLHTDELNPDIDFDETPFTVQRGASDWPRPVVASDDGETVVPRRAGVSSFGAGGSNAHVILEEPPSAASEGSVAPEGPFLFVLSARDDDRLDAYAADLLDALSASWSGDPEADPRPCDVAHTLQVGREPMEERLAFCASDRSEVLRALRAVVDGAPDRADVHRGTAQAVGTVPASDLDVDGVTAWMQAGRWTEVMEAWTSGATFAWHRLPNRSDRRIVSLPSYPFRRDSVWIADRDVLCDDPVAVPQDGTSAGGSADGASTLHPLVHRNVSTLDAIRFEATLTGNEFFLDDHCVGEQRVLPGVAIAEMARAAGEAGTERPVHALKNMTFARPMTVGDTPRTFTVGLKRSGDDAAFEVYSQGADGERARHAQGRLLFTPPARPDDEPDVFDIDAIRQRCSRRVDVEAGYDRIYEHGLRLGEGFRSNVVVHAGEREALSRLELPESLHDGFEDYVVHPSMMDGAQQNLLLAELGTGSSGIHIPFTLGELEVIRTPTSRTAFAYVEHVSGPAKPGAPTTHNVWLLDESGRALIAVRRLLTREPTALTGASAEASTAARTAASGDCFYFREAWETRRQTATSEATSDGPVLVFDVPTSARERVLPSDTAQRLAGEGASVIRVEPGDAFRNDGSHFTIDPGSPDHYDRLARALADRGASIRGVLHGWSTGRFEPTAGSASRTQPLRDQLQRGVFSVLSAAQALYTNGVLASGDQRFVYAYAGHPGAPQPQFGGVTGTGRTLLREHPSARWKTVEVVDDDRSDLADRLAAELNGDADWSAEIRYVDGERQVRTLSGVEPTGRDAATLRENGVYLLTGGTGGLGRIVARHLAERADARLVLAGRSPLDDAARASIDALRDRGADVTYVRADVTDASDVERLVATARETYGRLDGVVHAAGVNRDVLITSQDRDDAATTLAPKVQGTINLDAALADADVDFVALFSSVTAVVGNRGQSDYAFANRFMDRFAAWRNEHADRSGHTVSINWPLWRDGGMQVDDATEEQLFTTFGMRPLATDHGVDAFDAALDGTTSTLFVMEGDGDRIRNTIDAVNGTPSDAAGETSASGRTASTGDPASNGPASNGPASNEDPSNDAPSRDASSRPHPAPVPEPSGPPDEWIEGLHEDLTELVSEQLKIPASRIRVDRNVSDYGFNSVGLATFSNTINDTFGADTTPALFFEHPTIESIAEHLATTYPDALRDVYGEPTLPETSDAPPASDASAESGGSAPGSVAHRTSGDGRSLTSMPSSDGASTRGGRPVVSPTSDAPPADPNAIRKEPIAIVGLSGVMPQSENLDAFWKHLDAGHDLITEIPEERWDWRTFYGDPSDGGNVMNTKYGGFTDDVDAFDARFFGLSRREAEFMDPQQRVFLQTIWKTLESAGYPPSNLIGEPVGVFAGTSGLDYANLLIESGIDVEAYSTTGIFHSILANRISYLLGLRGPSVPVDTACSTALVAIRQACESIWTGGCDMALAGGVNLLLSPHVFISFSKAGMLSPDGRCKTFDESANGYVRAEGSAAVLLKPLRQAVEDRDTIRAVIRGSAVNHGGRVNTMTAPNPNAQADLIVDAVEEANVDPRTVTFVEAHGTGTSLGDPVEVNGLKKAYRTLYRRHGVQPPEEPHCGIGSVKTNTGHLETAAAMAGIAKVIHAMDHGRIPPNIHFEEQNPYVKLDDSPFYLVTESTPWTRQRDEDGRPIPRRAGVSSFGFGGVNGHLILEEYLDDVPASKDPAPGEPQLVVLSARTEERLRAYAAKLAGFFTEKASASTPPTTASGDGAPASLEERLLVMTAETVGVAVSDLPPDQSFEECGLDPVHLAALASRIEDAFDLSVPSSQVGPRSSVRSLARTLHDTHGAAAIEAATAVAEPPSEAAASPDVLPALAHVAYTLQAGREDMQERLAFVADDMDDVIETFEAFAEGEEPSTVVRGNPERDEPVVGALLRGDDGDAFVRRLMERRRLKEIAQLWVSGIDLDWDALHDADPAPRRIPLPTYPFARDRYWIPGVDGWLPEDGKTLSTGDGAMPSSRGSASAATPTVNVAPSSATPAEPPRRGRFHPLLDAVDPARSAGEGIVFRKRLTPAEPVLGHHRVSGAYVFPGVGHVSMALGAYQQLHDAPPVDLHDVLWLRPLIVEADGALDARVQVRPSGDGAYQYAVASGANPDAVPHATGVLRERTDAPETQVLDVEPLRERCTDAYDVDALYDLFADHHVDLGPYFQTLNRVWIGDGELLGELALDPSVQGDLETMPVHPGMMDAALQSLGALTFGSADAGHPGASGEGPLLPFAVDRVEVLRSLDTPTGFVFAQRVPSDTELRFNVALLDADRRVCVKWHDVTMRQQSPAPVPTSDDDPLDDFFYEPEWTRTTGDSSGAGQEGAGQEGAGQEGAGQEGAEEEGAEEEGGGSVDGPALIVRPRAASDDASALLGSRLARAHDGDVFEIRLGSANRQMDAATWEVDASDPDALDARIRSLPALGRILFLGAMQDGDDPLAASDLAANQERGVVSLFRLLQSLSEHAGASPLDVCVVTNDVHAVASGDPVSPLGADVVGLARTAGRERPAWTVRVVDVSRDDLDEAGAADAATAILDAGTGASGDVVALRGGDRYRRVLTPRSMPAPTDSPFRERGVYFIVGGMGGIGFALAQHLADTVSARLALVGRSPLDDAKREKVERLRALGADAEYIVADASDDAALRRAVDTVRERFGGIDGVVHSALVLRDRSLDRMTESDLHAALQPKSAGTRALGAVFADVDLDWMLVFSSAQTYSCTAGQGNYAAASTVQDAYARWLDAQVAYPVHLINWGYWGSVGVVATDEYAERLAERGIYSIESDEGIDAIERVLAGSVPQVTGIWAEPDVLDALGANRTEVTPHAPTPHAPTPPDDASATEVRSRPPSPSVTDWIGTPASEMALSPNVFERARRGHDALERFCATAVLVAFREAGLLATPGEQTTVNAVRQAIGAIPAYSRAVEAFVDVLATAGYVSMDGTNVTVNPAVDDAPSSVDALADVRDRLLERFPEKQAHVDLVWACVDHYLPVLRGETPPTEVLFPKSSPDLVAPVYRDHLLADFYNALVAIPVREIVDALRERRGPDETIRILEIGAGTGGTTASVLEALPDDPGALEYVYTDVSPHFTQFGRAEFGDDHSFLDFQVLDVEDDPAAQGFEPNRVDVIVAANVLHATRSLDDTLRHVKQLLRPGGQVVLNEVTDPLHFTTVTFGLLEGWWLFEDDRLPHAPLLSVPMWIDRLTALDFQDVQVLEQRDAHGDGLGQSILVATS